MTTSDTATRAATTPSAPYAARRAARATSAQASRRTSRAARRCREEVAALRLAVDALPARRAAGGAAARAQATASWRVVDAEAELLQRGGRARPTAAPARGAARPAPGWSRCALRPALAVGASRRWRRGRRAALSASAAATAGGSETRGRPGQLAPRRRRVAAARRRRRATLRVRDMPAPPRAASTRCGSSAAPPSPRPTRRAVRRPRGGQRVGRDPRRSTAATR